MVHEWCFDTLGAENPQQRRDFLIDNGLDKLTMYHIYRADAASTKSSDGRHHIWEIV